MRLEQTPRFEANCHVDQKTRPERDVQLTMFQYFMVGTKYVRMVKTTFVARSLSMGPTGFDSSKVGEVSMSGVGKTIRNQSF